VLPAKMRYAPTCVVHTDPLTRAGHDVRIIVLLVFTAPRLVAAGLLAGRVRARRRQRITDSHCSERNTVASFSTDVTCMPWCRAVPGGKYLCCWGRRGPLSRASPWHAPRRIAAAAAAPGPGLGQRPHEGLGQPTNFHTVRACRGRVSGYTPPASVRCVLYCQEHLDTCMTVRACVCTCLAWLPGRHTHLRLLRPLRRGLVQWAAAQARC
jgi:hypothetical protein